MLVRASGFDQIELLRQREEVPARLLSQPRQLWTSWSNFTPQRPSTLIVQRPK